MDENRSVRRARARGMDMMAVTMSLFAAGTPDAPVEEADRRARKAMQRVRPKKDRSKAKAAKASRKKNRK